MHLIELNSYPIFEQLKLEEALLRTNNKNWCLINYGSSPAIVMGISQDPFQVINLEKYKEKPIPIIRRYSGGGTVVIEPTTVLVSLIINHDKISANPFPKEVLKWTEALYQKAFPLSFALKENDYVFGEKKCGGNAQYFAKGRIVHHTSFVWDYSHAYMELLKIPSKMPQYRKSRSHQEFLFTLKDHFSSIPELIETLRVNIAQAFSAKISSLEEAVPFNFLPHRKTTAQMSLDI